MKKLTILAVALAALGLGTSAQARTGGWTGHVLYALESSSNYNTSATKIEVKGYTFPKNSLYDGQVIVMEAAGTAAVNASDTMTIDVDMGATAMITSGALVPFAGPWRIVAIGQVRSVDSVSSGTRTAGTILWSLYVFMDGSTDVNRTFCDTTADAIQTNIPSQDLTFGYTWSASSSANIWRTEQFVISTY